MKIKIMLLFFCLSTFMCCQEKKENKSVENNVKSQEKSNTMLKKVLKKQLKEGANKFIDEAGLELKKKAFEIEELDVTIEIISNILKSNAYNKLNNKDFSSKIKNIFGRTIDFNSDNKYLYVNYIDNCDKKFITFSNNGVDYNGINIVKNENFITEFYYLPEIIDYSKEFPELKDNENEEIIRYTETRNSEIQIPHWKDIPNLTEQRKNNIKTLIARNMYLFNDSRAYFTWLILNDEYFMQSLVTTFGYYDDKELLKWVVENTKFDSNSPNELDKIFWNKKCDGTVKLNLEIFPALKEIIKPEGTNYLEALKMYVMYLLEDKGKRNELSLQDRSKLLAHLVYFGEQYRYDKNYNNQSFFMQRIALFDLDEFIEKEIERNNFYNLPNYQNLYKKSEKYRGELIDENGG